MTNYEFSNREFDADFCTECGAEWIGKNWDSCEECGLSSTGKRLFDEWKETQPDYGNTVAFETHNGLCGACRVDLGLHWDSCDNCARSELGKSLARHYEQTFVNEPF